MDWFFDNKEWFFSGAGIFAIGILLRILFSRKRDGANLSIKSGNNCTNTQINTNDK
jgi:hypothetical protein